MDFRYELIKQSVLEGLRRANYNVTRFQPDPIKVSLFANRAEILAAENSARSIAQLLKMRAGRGELSNRDEIEKAVNMHSAESAYHYAFAAITVYMASGHDVSKYVQESRSALKILDLYPESFGDYYKRSFKKLIGEE